jgi:antitoxin (DNA-binding transcriptional repressor) of toxin-antitoxin stability system
MRQINLDEAPPQLDDLIYAAIEGEDVFIVTDDEQVIQLVPVSPARRNPQFGTAKGLIKMSDDFDAPLEDFAEYT